MFTMSCVKEPISLPIFRCTSDGDDLLSKSLFLFHSPDVKAMLYLLVLELVPEIKCLCHPWMALLSVKKLLALQPLNLHAGAEAGVGNKVVFLLEIPPEAWHGQRVAPKGKLRFSYSKAF
ncbi:unnamed protein product [Victoria cruziana]